MLNCLNKQTNEVWPWWLTWYAACKLQIAFPLTLTFDRLTSEACHQLVILVHNALTLNFYLCILLQVWRLYDHRALCEAWWPRFLNSWRCCAQHVHQVWIFYVISLSSMASMQWRTAWGGFVGFKSPPPFAFWLRSLDGTYRRTKVRWICDLELWSSGLERLSHMELHVFHIFTRYTKFLWPLRNLVTLTTDCLTTHLCTKVERCRVFHSWVDCLSLFTVLSTS